MNPINKDKFSVLKLTLAILVFTFVFLGCKDSAKKNEIRSEFFNRKKYRQTEMSKIIREIEALNRPLDELIMSSSLKISEDSIKSLIRESYNVLDDCERLIGEIEHFDKEDSLLFEMYGR